ncbi:MAG: DUF262 domain-containing HNH endonuclease family protein [Chloroflexi bacterium]|nr:DUF262 domain-containing HNH endonuclease family protein [Chloroflexota bacterium]
MEPRNHPLAQLFGGNLVYIVPNYQRLYVWSEDEQWEPLWLDVRDIAEELISRASGGELADADADGVEAHFLGAVVFKIGGSTPDLAMKYRVIDGQQRLTTLQILLAAAASAFEVAGLTEPANNLGQFTANTSVNQTLKIQYQRHQSGHDYERFPDVMAAAREGICDPSFGGPMADCYRYFGHSIQQWLGLHSHEVKLAGNALARTLALKLRVVAIYLDPHEREHAIFESLNARGEPLTEWDKIKNYLLYKADEDRQLSQETFFEQYLNDFDDPWWRQLTGRGVQRSRVDVFVDYWLEAQTGAPVAVRRVFREFQQYVDRRDDRLEAIVKQLLDDARYYLRSERMEVSSQDREALFHERRLAMGAGAVWPLLLKLRHLEIEVPEREACFATLESYLVRRLIAGYQARSHDQVALELIEALSDPTLNPEGSSEAMRAHLLAYSESANLWPSDAVTRQAVQERSLARYANQLVLAGLEREMISSMAGNPSVPRGLHVEHLMPQGWGPEEWPLPSETAPEEAEQVRSQAIITLGNLTLLNARLNSSASNRAWKVKREKIQESDNLFLNRRLLRESGDQWSEVDIEDRGRWIGDMVVKIWPRA